MPDLRITADLWGREVPLTVLRDPEGRPLCLLSHAGTVGAMVPVRIAGEGADGLAGELRDRGYSSVTITNEEP